MGIGARSCWVNRPHGTLVHVLKMGARTYGVKKSRGSQCTQQEQPGMRTMTTWEAHWPDQVFASCAPWWPAGVNVL